MKRILFMFFFAAFLAANANASTQFTDNMESGPGGWTATGLWHRATASDPCPQAHGGSASWYYGNASCNFDVGDNSGSLTSQTFYIHPSTMVQLNFWYWYQTEESGTSYDRRYIQIAVDGGSFTNLTQLSGDAMNTWLNKTIDLSVYAGHNIQLRFFFDTIDSILNNYTGWYIDDVAVYATINSANYTTGVAAYNWIDISATGTNTGIVCDDCGVVVPIGFNFNFYGNVYPSIGISSNGYFTFGPTLNDFSNDNIPNTATPNNIIALFWDDLRVFSTKGGAIYTQTTGSAPNRQFIVQYHNVDFFTGGADSGKLYFQAILSEVNGSITFQYKDMDSVNVGRGRGNSATIGIENYAGTDGILGSFNAPNLTNGLAMQTRIRDTDGDGLPDYWETAFGLNPTIPTDVTADVDADGLNWLQEFQYGTNPFNADTDGDGVSDGEEVAAGTNPLTNDGIQSTTVTFTGPGAMFGTAYFKFSVANLDPLTTGYRVYYGASSGATTSDYDAFLDINDVVAREGYIDQKWGMQGVPMVYFRVAPTKTVGGRTFVGALSNELSVYFSGSEPTKDAGGDTVPGGTINTTMQRSDLSNECFIATAAYGAADASPVMWLRKFRDSFLLTNAPGRLFVETYYRYSPPIAAFVREHEWAKVAVRGALLPAVGMSYLLVEASPATRVLVFAFLMAAIAWLVSTIMKRRRVKA